MGYFKSSRARSSVQRGAVMVWMAIFMVVMIGVIALAVDVGRLFVLRTEMQNAADAAALAGAVELDGRAGARARAEQAARTLLVHRAHFSRGANANEKDLLKDGPTIEFFCAINSNSDPANLDGICQNVYGADNKAPAVNDAEAHYIRVTLGGANSDAAQYSIELYFLPTLRRILGLGAETHAGTRAFAVAGRSFYMCNYPPLMICNPFEPEGRTFEESMTPGEQIQLKQQGGNTWAPGNFSFLQPDATQGGGATDIAYYLADNGRPDCTPPVVTTKTGGMTTKTQMAINTRFGIYGPPAPFADAAIASKKWPPAPDVIDFPRDQTWHGIDNRFGNGDWDRAGYWTDYHQWQGHVQPAGYDTMTRWEVYNWEIGSGSLPSKDPLKNIDDPTYDGRPDYPLNLTGWADPNDSSHVPNLSNADRRMLHIGVLNCMAYGITGSKTVVIQAPNGFAKIFLTEHVYAPPDATIYGEYMGWSDQSDPAYHVNVQLYE